MSDLQADNAAIEALVAGRHGDPFALLGPHGDAVRVLLPGAAGVRALSPDGRALATFEPEGGQGLFVAAVPQGTPYRLLIDWHGPLQETEDPYSFAPLLGELDLHLMAEGRHWNLASCLGAHPMQVAGVDGVRFAVWAPNASRVSVVGDFNAWDGRRHPMRKRHAAGVWELFVPRLPAGTAYKYEILGAGGEPLPLKADPVAARAEAAPATASVVADARPFIWTDDAWMARRAGADPARAPISVYEVHAQSWMHADGRPLDWTALADRLVPYAVGMGFTHIELLPVMIHPFGGSWGYQPLGQFAPTAELGSPEAFAAFVDRCHEAGVGLIIDWVPAHFPNDAHGLARFDGTPLYEHGDPREGVHRDWNTLIYNFGRNEVRGFLIASALHWIEHFHVDGIRVDAVASMLYRDYSREPGEWVANVHGGRENLEAVAFLREMNAVVAELHPGVLLIAEESTAWPGVTAKVSEQEPYNLGFTFKWNMGWMHDSLHYMQEDPINRRHHHGQMTFGLVYAFSERFVLPLSHDEVVHGKGSLIGKMPGDDWQRFANLRAYLSFMWTHPGKKLLFMGCEFAQEREWNHDVSLDWHLLDVPAHRGIQALLRDLNVIYAKWPALHALDCDPAGFRWLVGDDSEQSVFAYLRREADAPGAGQALVVCNFTPVPRYGYRVGVPVAGRWTEGLNSDARVYGGSGLGNFGGVQAEEQGLHGMPCSVLLTLPPLATIVLRPEASG